MKFYEFIIIFLKVATVIQLTLIFFKIQASDSLFYLFTDLLYKLTLGLFLLTFFYFNKTTGVDGWDELIISFGGVVILYDAWIMDIASILKAYNIKLKLGL